MPAARCLGVIPLVDQRRRFQIGRRMPVALDRAAIFEAGMPACSSSSLGKDSDDGSPPGKEAEVGAVQSAYKGVGLAGLGALEESLPIRRGITKFYNGKSKSSHSSGKQEAITPSGSSRVIAKADNAYTRSRKNLLAYSIMYQKSQISVPETYESDTPKRLASLSRLRPLDSISSNSSSSLSSDKNELPQQIFFLFSHQIMLKVLLLQISLHLDLDLAQQRCCLCL